MNQTDLKFVLVPWGSDSYGEDIWLLENALVFGLETVFEKIDISYADLYDQLGGSEKRTSIVRPYSDSDLQKLASRAPSGTTALIDGHISVVRESASGSLVSVEFAPRLLNLATSAFEIPDAFFFESFLSAQPAADRFVVEEQERWHALIITIAEALLRPFDREIPAHIGPECLTMTSSWTAYNNFLKGKRGARTVDEKLGHYRQASRSDPNFYWARFNAGQLYKQQQDYHSARREFLAAADASPQETSLMGEVYFELGLCSIFLGDTKTARNFWDQALTFAPSNPTLLVNLAGTYEQEENWVRAVELHEDAIRIDPDYYKALVSLGRLKAQAGQIEEAVPFYERALVLRPDDALRYAILGGCYLSMGNEEKARRYFERASELDPVGNGKEIRIDEADTPPAAGDYARQEIKKMDAAELQRQKSSNKSTGGWRWFGR